MEESRDLDNILVSVQAVTPPHPPKRGGGGGVEIVDEKVTGSCLS